MGMNLKRAATAALLSLAVSGAAIAQQDAPAKSDQELLEDFIHFVQIARLDAAEAYARELIDRQVDPRQFIGMVEDSATMSERFQTAVGRAMRFAELEGVAAELEKLYEAGRLARARDPNEIARNIALLTGAPRGQLDGRRFLAAAGEYSVPQLLQVLLDRQDQALETEVEVVLTQMGSQAVGPLTAALGEVGPTTQERIARVLGRLGYDAAIPYLSETHRTTSDGAVRAACEIAIRSLGGSPELELPLSGLYRELGERYYSESRSLTSFPGEDHQLLWSFEPQLGLVATAIRTEVYHEARAMGLAEKALTFDPTDEPAMALWTASNFSRELDSPEGYDNPAYGSDRREAMYYAVAAGPSVTQRVLERALRTQDTRLARLAIEALANSAGSNALVGGGGTALIDALSYPNRRVRYEAALAIGHSHPRSLFAGAEQVIPILASMIGEASAQYAIIVAADLDRQQELRTIVEGMGYTVLPPVSELRSARRSIAEAPGIELIVTDLTADSSIGTIEEIRSTARLRATPVLALMGGAGYAQHSSSFDGDPLTEIGRTGVSSAQMEAAIDSLVRQATGAPVTGNEAEIYALQALALLRDLAISSGGAATAAFDIADASVPLVDALNVSDGDIRLHIADVLSHIGNQQVQVALMDAAMDAFDDDRIELLDRVTASAKRFGNMLERRQVSWLVETAGIGADGEAVAAASLMGALDLPKDEVVPLILGGEG